jgi:hypothetical protein
MIKNLLMFKVNVCMYVCMSYVILNSRPPFFLREFYLSGDSVLMKVIIFICVLNAIGVNDVY